MDSEDPRKKRDCAEVVEQLQDGTTSVNEKTKKLRKENRVAAAAAANTEETRTEQPEHQHPETSDGSSNDQDDSEKSNPATEPADSCQHAATNATESEVDTTTLDSEAAAIRAETTTTSDDAGVAGYRRGNENEPVVWDVESALNYLTRLDEGKEEYLNSSTKVSFRVGHAGDAATIASWYRQRYSSEKNDKPRKLTDEIASKCNDLENLGEGEEEGKPTINDSEGVTTTRSLSTTEAAASTTQASAGSAASEQEAASSLELWLADGLGDEGVPPSAYTLLAHTMQMGGDTDGGSSSKTSRLAAVALLTLAWEDAARVLRLEWMRVDPELDVAEVLERRMRLRLSALSLMAACELHIINPDVY